jgi:ketosteroid isomerase-like protein
MSRENVELVRTMYQAFNRGDTALALQMLHPSAELHQPPEMADAGSYYGREDFTRGLALWLREWDEPRYEPIEAREVAGNVIMRVRVSGRGRASGIPTDADFFHAWTVRDGKPHRCFVRSTEQAALEAVGVEQSGS